MSWTHNFLCFDSQKKSKTDVLWCQITLNMQLVHWWLNFSLTKRYSNFILTKLENLENIYY
jgi:hypothetical protein